MTGVFKVSKSKAIVGFIANLMPTYSGEKLGGEWVARDIANGAVISPLDGDPDDDPWVRVLWPGATTTAEIQAETVAAVALVKYVRFHAAGHPADVVARELHFLSRHFQFKTGASLYLPSLPPEPTATSKFIKAAGRMGEGMLTDFFSRLPTGGI